MVNLAIGRAGSLANSPALQVTLVAGLALVKVFGHVQGLDTLRVWYSVGISIVFTALYLLARLRGVLFPGWITAVLFAYVAFELLIPITPLYFAIPFLDRFEHFGAFAVLTLFLLSFALMMLRRVPKPPTLALLALLVWAVGWANEAIEYFIYARQVFFTRDTILDLTMNTLAITLVILVAPRLLNSGK